jgi:hypothetical protein
MKPNSSLFIKTLTCHKKYMRDRLLNANETLMKLPLRRPKSSGGVTVSISCASPEQRGSCLVHDVAWCLWLVRSRRVALVKTDVEPPWPGTTKSRGCIRGCTRGHAFLTWSKRIDVWSRRLQRTTKMLAGSSFHETTSLLSYVSIEGLLYKNNCIETAPKQAFYVLWLQ